MLKIAHEKIIVCLCRFPETKEQTEIGEVTYPEHTTTNRLILNSLYAAPFSHNAANRRSARGGRLGDRIEERHSRKRTPCALSLWLALLEWLAASTEINTSVAPCEPSLRLLHERVKHTTPYFAAFRIAKIPQATSGLMRGRPILTVVSGARRYEP